MMYVPLILVPLCALLRVMDGGWNRLPGSNIILWVSPPVLIWVTSFNPYLAVVGVFLSWQWVQGYEDWESVSEQLQRCLPVMSFAAACGVLNMTGLIENSGWGLGLGVLAVVLSNVCQPWLRRWMEGRGPWATHSNRYAELLEGAAIGGLCGFVG